MDSIFWRTGYGIRQWNNMNKKKKKKKRKKRHVVTSHSHSKMAAVLSIIEMRRRYRI